MSQPSLSEESIFLQALEIPSAAERAAYLEQACAGNPDLRPDVEALLRAHEQAGDLLDLPDVMRETQGEVSTGMDDGDDLGFLVPSDKPGSLGRLGHYDIQEVVGRGGMGIVLRAFDDKLHRVVAIKVMAAQLATNATARKRFTREAQAQAAVSHDHIVTIHAVEDAEVLPYLVMQYVSGMSLQQRLDRDGPLQLHEILRVGMQTASALAAAHAQGLIHRDIKPANILLENSVERVKITDFGLARAGSEASLTQSGVVAGTPQYMSPEQAEGTPLDQRTDMFSLGSVLYAMCTGRAPFRASGSMAVLKRVCEETPTPIRETNPEIPDWLVAIIDKLHAKDPAERFQSAAEVAELLSRHLAHVQHPSVAPLPALIPLTSGGRQPPDSPAPSGGLRPPLAMRRRRLAVAAAILLCLIGGLSLTEATGVTNLRATVIRILTPYGTLVVEIDDPAVKVTVEGDGGLVITGAGLEEIRLRPGSYRVHADRNGKPVPLDKDLVTVARGGRAIVKVKLERAPAQVGAKAEQGAFILLAAGKERKFNTLAEAVQGASDGDTIEVRGNGPFLSQRINIARTALTIRAGQGFRPVIKLSPDAAPRQGPLLATNAPLALEGLELHRAPPDVLPGSGGGSVVRIDDAPLRAANCRFRAPIWAHQSPVCMFRNCEFLCGEATNLGAVHGPGARVSIENGVHWTRRAAISTTYDDAAALRDISLQVERSTFVGHASFWVPVHGPLPQPSHPIRLKVAKCIFDCPSVLSFQQTQLVPDKVAKLEPAEAEAMLLRRLQWQGDRNLFASGSTSVKWGAALKPQPAHDPKTLKEWKRFWGTAEADSLEGTIRFQGGNLQSRTVVDLDQLTPADFRLRPDSAGYKAGKNGKDLGADVDLVGPGAAYERWKKTPEYQQWLKDTKQATKAEAPTEPKVFVVLTSKGVEVRKFDTLAEAVQGASDGDTIEVRGNGPFLSSRIRIQGTALTIRAGEGFRPVIKLGPQAVPDKGGPFLASNAALVLEGLELHRARPESGPWPVVRIDGAPLRAANCRFRPGIFAQHSPVCVFRNCEFLYSSFSGMHRSGGRVSFDNCVYWTEWGAIVSSYEDPAALRHISFQIARSTFVGHFFFGVPLHGPLPDASQPFRLEVSRCVLACASALDCGPASDKMAMLGPAEAEAMLLRRLQWRGERNLFASGSTSVRWSGGFKQQPPHGPKSLNEWKQFWGIAEADSLEATIRFQGGNLRSRAEADLDRLTPGDFRLHPDSAGYRAGKDGKDLGADVDLVGPGPAYDRWKKTPEYQQWLKDTGQKK